MVSRIMNKQESNQSERRAHKTSPMITKKVLPLTIYNTVCVECGAEGPAALSEDDAHLSAIRKGWTLYEEGEYKFYVCSSRVHEKFRALYTLRKYVEELKEKQDKTPVAVGSE